MGNLLHYASKNSHDIFVRPTPATPMAIPDDVYRELAEKIRIEAEYSSKDYAILRAEAERGNGLVYDLTISAYLYYDVHKAPDAIWRELTRITSVWFECHTYDEAGVERLNDFDIRKFKDLIKNIL